MNTLAVEEWKPVPGYERTYAVSSLGRVMRIDSGKGIVQGRIRKLVPRNGYFQLALSQDAKVTVWWAHRLVALAFIEKPPGCNFVNHKDGNGQNNHVANLEWTTHAGNMAHAYANGLRHASPNPGSKNGNALLKETDIILIRNLAQHQSLAQIGRNFGVSKHTIWKIVHRRSWTHVT